MEARLDIARRSASACDDARALASLALDGALTDEVGRRFLRRHLGECAACARFAADIAHATELVRAAPLDSFRCGPFAGRRAVRVGAHRGHWATTAAAVVAIAVGVTMLPQSSSPPATPPPVSAAVGDLGRAPVKLPIGQKSAEDDFTPYPQPYLT